MSTIPCQRKYPSGKEFAADRDTVRKCLQGLRDVISVCFVNGEIVITFRDAINNLTYDNRPKKSNNANDYPTSIINSADIIKMTLQNNAELVQEVLREMC